MIRNIVFGWGFFFAREAKFTARIKSWLEDSDPANVHFENEETD